MSYGSRTKRLVKPQLAVLSAVSVGIAMLCLSVWVRGDTTLTIVDTTGAPVADVIVELPEVLASSPDTAVIDQIDKRFVPFVSTVSQGTLVNFPNSDDTRHHVYSFSEAKNFELKLYSAGDAEPILFDQPGLVTLGCNIHDNMKAYVYVGSGLTLSTDSNGQVVIPLDMPPIAVGLWHWQLDAQRMVMLPAPVEGQVRISLDIVYDSTDQQKPKETGLRGRFQRDGNQ